MHGIEVIDRLSRRRAGGIGMLAGMLVLGALGALGALTAPPARADDGAPSEAVIDAPIETWAVHGQVTFTDQAANDFRSPYQGSNSLTPKENRETTDVTLFLGARLWRGAEVWFAPEADEGFGLDDTLGVAGFPSGEAYKVGANAPYCRMQRAFVRQTLDVGEDGEVVEGGAGQLGARRSADRWVITVGKFSVPDVFDTNQYAHDPRGDFLNWSVIDTGTFDYAADAWGYTIGAALERYRGDWTARVGFFDLSDVPNSPDIEPAFHEFQTLLEGERRYRVMDAPGRVLLTWYRSRGRMALLSDAIEYGTQNDEPPQSVPVRRYRTRQGVSVSLEQALTQDLGFFMRAGKTAGNVEAYEFTEIDRTVAAGFSLKGASWHRASDTLGIAAVVNGISAEREAYLAAGGLGFLVGDGRLPHPGAEQIVETYYSLGLFGHVALTLDYQHIRNPAYNEDRGPVSVFAVRVHAQF